MTTLLDSAGAPPVSEEKKKKAGLPFQAYQELKSSVHRELLNRVDLEKVATLRDGRIRGQVFAMIQDLIANLNAPMSGAERERLAREVLDEVFGLGPIEPLLQDPTINDILVNTHKHVYVERAGMLEETNVMFKDDAHLLRIDGLRLAGESLDVAGRAQGDKAAVFDGEGLGPGETRIHGVDSGIQYHEIRNRPIRERASRRARAAGSQPGQTCARHRCGLRGIVRPVIADKRHEQV